MAARLMFAALKVNRSPSEGTPGSFSEVWRSCHKRGSAGHVRHGRRPPVLISEGKQTHVNQKAVKPKLGASAHPDP